MQPFGAGFGAASAPAKRDAREAREIFLEEGAGLGFADGVAQCVGFRCSGSSGAIFADVGTEEVRAVL